MILISLTTLTLILLGIKMRAAYSYWKNKNVVHIKPWPLFGFVAPTIVRYRSYPMELLNIYKAFPEQRCFGLYKFVTPYLVLKSPDLIERITVKDWENFPNHKREIDSESDPIYSKLLFAMNRGEQWKEARAVLSKEKLNKNLELIQECAMRFVSHFSNETLTKVELGDVCSKFANDAIAAIVFGCSCNSLTNPNNDFYLMTKYTVELTLLRKIKFFLFRLSPRFLKFFKFSLLDKRIKDFYKELISNNTPELLRCSKKCDAEKKNGEESKVTVTNETIEEEILAQAIQFLLFGYKTVSRSLIFLLHELSLNSQIQEKLFNELDSVGTDFSIESLEKLVYLDMVVAESLRKWPPTLTTDRQAENAFVIEPIKSWEDSRNFDAGTLCLIPIFAIHRDAKNFPEPDVFDPERFARENRDLIKPYTYIPFGAGDRGCVGEKFALLQIKTFLFYLLREFMIVRVDESNSNITLSKSVFQLVPAGKTWVGFERRSSQTVKSSTVPTL